MAAEELSPPVEISAPAPAGSRHRGRIAGLLGVSALVLAVALLSLAALVGPRAAEATNIPSFDYAGIPTAGYTLGAADAPVTIDIYMDFQCPICHDWYTTIFPSLRAGPLSSGEAKLVFHGTSAAGPESVAADKAAYAAAQQGYFWDMWTTLYDHQGADENSGAFSDANLRALAQNLGLDMTRYDADFASAAAQDFVSAGETDSHAHNITGTPTLIIAGVQYPGVGSYADLAAAIGAAQASASPSR